MMDSLYLVCKNKFSIRSFEINVSILFKIFISLLEFKESWYYLALQFGEKIWFKNVLVINDLMVENQKIA